MAARPDPERLREALDAALPDGLDLVRAVEAVPGALADRREASSWVLAFRDLEVGVLQAAAQAFLACERVEVTRVLKAGPRTFDARAAVLAMTVDDTPAAGGAAPWTPAGCAIFRMVVRHTTPAVRPDDVLTALRAAAALEPPTTPLATRLAQGPLRPGATVGDPLEDGVGA